MKKNQFKAQEVLKPQYITGGTDDVPIGDEKGTKKKKKKKTFWEWVKGIFVKSVK